MNRNDYYFGIFVAILNMVIIVIHVLLHLKFDSGVYSLPSFLPYVTVTSVIFLAWILVILRYYYFKKYWSIFTVSIFFMLATGFRYVVLYFYLKFGELANLYFPSYYLVLAVDFLYALFLIFSQVKERRWLRIAGFVSILFSVVLIVTLAGYSVGNAIALKSIFEKIHNYTSWVSGFIPILFLINFFAEIKKNEVGKVDPGSSGIHRFLMLIIGITAVLSTTVLAYRLNGEKPVNGYVQLPASTKAKAMAARFEARVFVSVHGDTLKYRLMKPLNYDSTKKYPLAVCLHGGAGWGTDNIIQIDGSLTAQLLSNYLTREKYPAFIFVPQCPPGSSWGGLPNMKTIDTLVYESMFALEKEFSIDKNRRYVSGNSLGGYGSWAFIAARPDLFAAAIPISGAGDPGMSARIANIPVWAFHGVKDINVPVSGSRDMVNGMIKAGGHPKYTEYPDADHDIWKMVVNTPGLVEWLFAQKKE